MAGCLGIAPAIQDCAKEVFKKMAKARAWPLVLGKTNHQNNDQLYAACLAIACRSEGSPRSINEIASAMAEGSTARREIAKLTACIRKHLGEEGAGLMGVSVVRALSYLCHFGRQLDMSGHEVTVAKEAARWLEEDNLGVRNTDKSIVVGTSAWS
ncbi:hypothetical protein ACQJBY_003798 [Aegilops geniculata]